MTRKRNYNKGCPVESESQRKGELTSMACVCAPFPAISHHSNLRSPRYLLSSPTRIKLLFKFDFVPERAAVLNSSFRCFSGSSSSSSSSPPPPPEAERDEEDIIGTRDSQLSISPYGWCAGLGAIGFLETSYLAITKLSNTEAFCPIGGGSCSDVLNSDYAVVFGIPLPLFGMVAYGLVASTGLQMAKNSMLFGLGRTDLRLILLGTATSMAAASLYFVYLLNTKLAGVSCSYCLFSAALSFTLFFVMVKDFGLQEIQKVLGLQLAVAGIVVAALSSSYSVAQPQLSGSSDFELEPFETEITTTSSSLAISLAKHLHSIGAKMYGAFWCSHCIEQKQMFGREAMQIVDYVECFPDGAGKGRKMTKACADIGVEGFPTWVIKDQVLSGEQDLQALVEASGFAPEDSNTKHVTDIF